MREAPVTGKERVDKLLCPALGLRHQHEHYDSQNKRATTRDSCVNTTAIPPLHVGLLAN